MITYNWDCKSVDVFPQLNGETNIIHKVNYIVTGVSDQLKADGEPYSTQYRGAQNLVTDNLSNVIPFENLTNGDVTSWVKESMGTKFVSGIENVIKSNIDSIIAPQSIKLTIGS